MKFLLIAGQVESRLVVRELRSEGDTNTSKQGYCGSGTTQPCNQTGGGGVPVSEAVHSIHI